MGFIFGLACFIFFIGIPALVVLFIIILIKPYKFNRRFRKDYTRRKIASVGFASILVTLIMSLTAMALTVPPIPSTQPTQQVQAVQQARSEAPKPITKIETTTESVAFETIEQQDNTLPSGQRQTTTEGVNGVKTHTYEVTYLNGVEQSRKETNSEITVQPLTKVVRVGTYVATTPAPTGSADCPSGTYVNSVGNTVCRPYVSSSVPVGATAQCNDGTYSFSQSRRGTCSYHGGVATWL